MYKLIISFLAILIPAMSIAQEMPDTAQLHNKDDSLFFEDKTLADKFYTLKKLDPEVELDEQLLPLSEIIEIALQNNPTVKSSAATAKSLEYQTELSKRLWQQNIMGNANYFQGSQYQMSLLSDGGQSYFMGNGFRYGVNVNVPLFEFSGRKSRIRAYEQAALASSYEQEADQQAIRRQVIDEYTNLVTAQRILKIEARGRDQALINRSNAEMQFKTGDLSMTDYSRIAEISKRAELDFEIARREFFKSYYRFEELVGEKMENLTGRRR